MAERNQEIESGSGVRDMKADTFSDTEEDADIQSRRHAQRHINE